MWGLNNSSLFGCLSFFSLLCAPVFADQKNQQDIRLSIGGNFPDPAFLEFNNTWYAFGSNGYNKSIQIATSRDFRSWTLLEDDALPQIAEWELEVNHWAPDVIQGVSFPLFFFFFFSINVSRLFWPYDESRKFAFQSEQTLTGSSYI